MVLFTNYLEINLINLKKCNLSEIELSNIIIIYVHFNDMYSTKVQLHINNSLHLAQNMHLSWTPSVLT